MRPMAAIPESTRSSVRPAAPRPRRTALATAPPGPGHQPGRVRLRHRDPPRRRADPAVPAALRRLSPFVRVRDLLRRPATLRRRRPAHRIAGGHTPTSPRYRLHRPPRRARTRNPDELTGPPT